jgi:hypothetical protein
MTGINNYQDGHENQFVVVFAMGILTVVICEI